MYNLFSKTAYGNISGERDSIDLREVHQHREAQQALAFLVDPNQKEERIWFKRKEIMKDSTLCISAQH